MLTKIESEKNTKHYRAIRFRYRDGYRLGMDIQP